MEQAVITERVRCEQDAEMSAAVAQESPRLLSFIRSRVPDPGEAEDLLQDVLYEFVAAYRFVSPVRHASGWLFRVARNRVTDWFRKKRPELYEDDVLRIEEYLPSAEDGPAEALARKEMLSEIEAAIAELPEEQRSVFVAHEVDGVSFRELAERTGLSVNTLLSRKRYAVAKLRETGGNV